MRIDRMLAITIMLLNRERISARELADHFEVSVRTIYRDIDAINLAGIPVISYPGNSGGFGIMENFKLDRQLLTLNDMIAIISALKGISDTLDYRELDTAIEKISNLMPDRSGEKGIQLTEQLVIDILPWGYRKRQRDVLQVVHQSIQACRKLSFLYRNSQGESIHRTVEPMTLVFKGYAWYLFAYCTLKSDYRIFRLSRMGDLEVSGETFVRRDASYRRYFLPEEKIPSMVDLVLEFSPDMRSRVEDYYDENLIEGGENGCLIVSVSFPEDEWVYSHILSYGENVKVLQPERIAQIIEKKAQRISQLYQT